MRFGLLLVPWYSDASFWLFRSGEAQIAIKSSLGLDVKRGPMIPLSAVSSAPFGGELQF